MEIVAAEPAGDVHGFADKEEAGRGARFHRLLRERVRIDAAARDLGLGVAFRAGGRQRKGFQRARDVDQRGVFHGADLLGRLRLAIGPSSKRARKPLWQQFAQHAFQVRLGALALAPREHVFSRVGQPIDRDRFARRPIGGGLQHRRPRKSAMGEQRRLAKRRLAGARNHLGRNARKRAHPGKIGVAKGERREARAGRNHGQAELLGDLERKAARAELGNGKPARRHAQRLALERALIGLHHEALGAPHRADTAIELERDAAGVTLVQQHAHDLL